MEKLEEVIKYVEGSALPNNAPNARAPSGLTYRAETFCIGMVTHGDEYRAMVEAGYKVDGDWRQRFNSLAGGQKIRARIAELQGAKTFRNSITQDRVLQMIQEIQAKAVDKAKYGDALKAVEMLVEYSKIFNKDDSALPGATKATAEVLERWAKAAGVQEKPKELPENVVALVPKVSG